VISAYLKIRNMFGSFGVHLMAATATEHTKFNSSQPLAVQTEKAVLVAAINSNKALYSLQVTM